MNTHEELVRELKSLRKGRAVLAGRLGDRIGPHLRTMCGIADDDKPVTVRGKVVARLIELAEQLPDDLRLATTAAFALGNEVRLPLLQDRVQWVAARMDRDARTVRRRMDDAIDHIAELVATAPRALSGDWHTERLSVAATLDQPRPELLEQYRVVADRGPVHELVFTSPLAVGRGCVAVDLLYGGTLHGHHPADHDRHSFTLVLPEPLSRGESHDFAVRFRLRDPRAMRSYLVQASDHPCERFDLRVRFPADQDPPGVWTLRDAPETATFRPVHHGQQHAVNRSGEIHLRYRQLIPGLVYGATWRGEDAVTGQPATQEGHDVVVDLHGRRTVTDGDPGDRNGRASAAHRHPTWTWRGTAR